MQRKAHKGLGIAGTLVACTAAAALFLGASVAQAHVRSGPTVRTGIRSAGAKVFGMTKLPTRVSPDVLSQQRGRGIAMGDVAAQAIREQPGVILWDEGFNGPRGQQTQDRADGSGNLQGSTITAVLP